MSQKLVLIDGHSILNRAFYGVPDLSNAEGLHTNAIYGFLNIMFKILEEEKPEYLAVAFDVHAPTFRHKMYEAYKGTRKPMPEELREQVPVMKEILKAMHITIMEQAGLEADDILGTLAKKAEQAGLEVSLVSGDRDLLQIATDHIKIRIPKTKQGKTEIENYYAADVVVMPIFSGSGMKTKTAEALMYGKNILGTKEAFEGYDMDSNCMYGCQTAEMFIDTFRSMGNNITSFNPHSRNLYLEKYSEKAVFDAFKKIFQ